VALQSMGLGVALHTPDLCAALRIRRGELCSPALFAILIQPLQRMFAGTKIRSGALLRLTERTASCVLCVDWFKSQELR